MPNFNATYFNATYLNATYFNATYLNATYVGPRAVIELIFWRRGTHRSIRAQAARSQSRA
jgi:hypothetical protein